MEIEIRGDRVRIGGYVNAVERDSKLLSPAMCLGAKKRFVERIRAGTFHRALQRASCVELRINHGRVVGTTKDGTVRLEEDVIGLKAIVDTGDPETVKKARNGEFRGWSFGFHKLADCWEPAENDTERRFLEDIDLREVSLLTANPAYIATTVEMRGEDTVCTEQRSQPDEPRITGGMPELPADLSNYRRQIEIYEMGGL